MPGHALTTLAHHALPVLRIEPSVEYAVADRMDNQRPWDVASPLSWAEALGLIHVPMFGAYSSDTRTSVLLDGARGSFAFSLDDPDAAPILGWSWSANLTHAVSLNAARSTLELSRWDAPGEVRRFALPKSARGAEELIRKLEEAPAPRSGDVVLHALRTFRDIRELLHDLGAESAVRVFNLLLLASELVWKGTMDREALLRSESPADLIRVLSGDPASDPLLPASGLSGGELPEAFRRWRGIPQGFLAVEQRYQYEFVPELLLRHASGQLYQEAHLVLERSAQLPLLGIAALPVPHGAAPAGVRFTPAPLARSLAESAIRSLVPASQERAKLTVLDPACGSGVFLVEAIREIVASGFKGELHLVGIDVSPVSCAMANFAVAHALQDANAAGIKASLLITNGDALEEHWGNPDVVLMNPPFIPWQRLSGAQQKTLHTVLGNLVQGRADLAIAFLKKAADQIVEGGTVATVLPAPLLENFSTEPVREYVANTSDLLLIGRFEGYKYFKASMVEPAVVVFRKRYTTSLHSPEVTVLIAAESASDRALRELRRVRDGYASDEGWEIYAAAPSGFASATWVARRRKDELLRIELIEAGMPRVEDLFSVRQGALSGNNDAFILDIDGLMALPTTERALFRPMIGRRTLRNGKLEPHEYLFYPYNVDGAILDTELDLAKAAPHYYEHLVAFKDTLAPRSPNPKWWELRRSRTWQHTRSPKLVSTYFGGPGNFGFDETGDYVVVHGYAWDWRPGTALATNGGDDGEQAYDEIDFYESDLPWAYLALLNSEAFAKILAFVCPRVQGGQFNLSARFVNRAVVPNLADAALVRGETTAALAELGRAIARAGLRGLDDLEHWSRLAFGVFAGKF